MGWISVDDALPPHGVTVDTWVKSSNWYDGDTQFRVSDAILYPNGWCHAEEQDGANPQFLDSRGQGFTVTHWMPLPDPPVTSPAAQTD